MTLLEGYQHLPIERPHRGGIGEGQVHAADRKSDVIEHEGDFIRRNHLPDDILHLGETLFGLLDPGTARGADV